MCFRKITPEAPGRWIGVKGEDGDTEASLGKHGSTQKVLSPGYPPHLPEGPCEWRVNDGMRHQRGPVLVVEEVLSDKPQRVRPGPQWLPQWILS